jgi:glycosyltransferase involved in cell wall biosynthesis
MTRILLLISDLHTGGAERHLSLLAPALRRRGHDVAVYLFGPGRDFSGPLQAADIPIIDGTILARRFAFLPSPVRGAMIRVAMIAQLAMHLRQGRYDLHHAFLPQPCVFLALAAKLARVGPVILSRRSMNDYRDAAPWEWRLESRLMRGVDLVLGNARVICEQLAEEEGVPRERLGYIPNGVNPDAFGRPGERAAMRRNENIAEGTLVMVMAASLSARKGHAVLFEALRRAESRMPPNWLLMCAGDGAPELARELRHQADYFAGKVRMLGRRQDVYALNQMSDLGILCPVHSEGMSNSVQEGLAAGLPFIVTDVGGNAELVTHGQTGLVVPPGDAAALAEALVALAGAPELRRRMGEVARRLAEREFSLDRCVDRYEQVYRSVLEGAALPQDLSCV